jgi:aminopeptidase YwaD
MQLHRARRQVALGALISIALGACAGNETGSPPSQGVSPQVQASIETEATPSVDAERSEVEDEQIGSAPLSGFSKKRAMAHIRKLARDIGVRERATPNERAGARYVARKFRSFGYDVVVQRFSVDGGTSRNVVASWPGGRRYGLVIGGHMDSVPGAPGANDNASGTAVVLELARIFAGTDQATFIKFVGFGSEEFGDDGRHHVGSQVYVRRLGVKGRNRLAGAISVDMIADGRPLLVGNSDIADDVLARTFYRKVKRTGIGVRYEVLCDCSDHGPFEHAGIPGAFAYSGREPDYHSPSDTVPNLKPDDVLRTGRAVRALVKDVDLGMLRKLRREG